MTPIVIIIDNHHVAMWQKSVMDYLSIDHKLHIFSCTNTVTKKNLIANFAYYVLNVVSLRNKQSKHSDIRTYNVQYDSITPFRSEYVGAWQSLPEMTISALNRINPAFIVKFGMALLRIPDAALLPVPILSYHHGDPREFRGRPAGFYEMCERRSVVGQIIQILNNRIDGGRVVAFGETKVYRHSYSKTNSEALEHSPNLMIQAVRNLNEGLPEFSGKLGRNYRLPSNLFVVRAALEMFLANVRQLVYGMFIEKRWNVSLIKSDAMLHEVTGEGKTFPDQQAWINLQTPEGYTFLADPFPVDATDTVLVEALRRDTGLGDLLRFEHVFDGRSSTDGASATLVLQSASNGHLSFPSGIAHDGQWLVVPETADWSKPVIFRLDGDTLKLAGELRTTADEPIIDPVLHVKNGCYYLFGNCFSSGIHALRLWTSHSLNDVFQSHPKSPLLVSPRGARMAGSLLAQDGRLFRLGQDFSASYGDGLCFFEIDTLEPDTYSECLIGTFKFKERAGPHTINALPDGYVFDWYREKFSPMAGIRRLRARTRRRRPTLHTDPPHLSHKEN